MSFAETLDVAIRQCIAYHGKTYNEALDTTLVEYRYLEQARRLRRQHEVQLIHEQAWAYNQVKAQKEVGKGYRPYYRTFKDFYDAEEEYSKALFGETRNSKSKRETVYKVAEDNKHLIDNEEIERQNRILEEEIRKQQLNRI